MGTSASTAGHQETTNGFVKVTSGEVNATKRNHEIEKMLAKDGIAEAERVKLLLLGSGESGKSTFVKQMRILHLNGFTEQELLTYKNLVHSNTATALHQILQAIHYLKIEPDGLTLHDIHSFQQLTNSSQNFDYEMTPTIGLIMKRIWYSMAAQNAYARRNEFEVLDSAKYFLDKIDTISSMDYVPSPDDIVRSRAATVGIYEIGFSFRGKEFKLVDVGGQRTERRKWIHCFDNVTAILFISSLSEYDQCLHEDQTTNRLDDSLTLFGFITKNPYLAATAIILFLNKKDILKEKVATTPFTVCRPNYKGEQSYTAIRNYILDEFTKRKPADKPLYSYFTEATDTRNVDVVFCTSMDIILAKTFSNVGFN